MIEKLLWWIVKKCVFYLDRNDLMMCYSFAKNDHTDYHILVERWFPECHMYGTEVTKYEDQRTSE